eukprot:COSAG02_NODE_35341_length_470_cov_0.552561_1_plen_96_part_10
MHGCDRSEEVATEIVGLPPSMVAACAEEDKVLRSTSHPSRSQAATCLGCLIPRPWCCTSAQPGPAVKTYETASANPPPASRRLRAGLRTPYVVRVD